MTWFRRLIVLAMVSVLFMAITAADSLPSGRTV